MKDNIPTNPILAKLPLHLHQYIIPQNYDNYSAIDQAVWRYVMRKNIHFLSKVAHGSYVDGLKKTGVSIERIPDMYGMNRILQEIGWAAAAVDGFIPPAAFMEFQAYNVLVIASDIRTLDHIEYTPAPDIIHEAAGHAPIIANPEYAEYLRRLGAIGCKAISSSLDWEIYAAVRRLSQLKEQDTPDEKAIKFAQEKVDDLQGMERVNSEMARIRNLQWWSVEYGLIGSLDDYKIYGAGLLSSIGESEWCLSEKVIKRPYNILTADVNFDITRPQPHLFVTPDFAHLSYVLDEFANGMALRKGGAEGLAQLIESKALGTIELSTGLQVSGVFSEQINYKGQPVFFKLNGPTALAYREKELIGHGTDVHPDGFASPIGKLKGINLPIEDMSPRDLDAYDIYEGRRVCLEFEGGLTVDGEVITGTRNLQGKILLIGFRNCEVKHFDRLIFSPSDGIFNMAVGSEIVSAFAGCADPDSFDQRDPELSESGQINKRSEIYNRRNQLYTILDTMCNGKIEMELSDIDSQIGGYFGDDWLLNLNLYELADKIGDQKVKRNVLDRYKSQISRDKEKAKLFRTGMEIFENEKETTPN